jgi:phosphate transport system protein
MTIRMHFDEELKKLHGDILLMSAMVEEMLTKSIVSLIEKDPELAEKVIMSDEEVDKKEIEIQDFCIKLIARQQPLAKDLRLVATALKIITDLERIADHAVDIAKITKRIYKETYIKPLIDIPRMADLTIIMLKDSIDSYVKEDIDLAQEISLRDDEIDALFKQVYMELLCYMMEDPKKITQATHFLFIGRYLERVADHITNICEAIIYLVTGEYKDLNE